MNVERQLLKATLNCQPKSVNVLNGSLAQEPADDRDITLLEKMDNTSL